MSNLQIQNKEEQLVVDSRLVSKELGIEHKHFVRTIRKYQETIESSFGCLSLENSNVELPNGGTREDFSHYWLNEEQATFLMTLSRNTTEVIQCKANLVQAFSEAKRQLSSNQLSVPKDYPSALRAAAEAYEQKQLALEKLDKAEDTITTYKSILSDQAGLTVSNVAKGLNIKGLGRNNMFAYLREKDFIQKNQPEPYQCRIEQDLAFVTTYSITVGSTEQVKQQTKLTFKGLKWLVKNLIKDGYIINTTAQAVWDQYSSK